MTGAWRGGLSLSNAQTYGVTPATSLAFGCNGSATTTYAKGSWTQMTAAATYDSTWIMVWVQTAFSGGWAVAVDIGVGASGSEVVIVNNLAFTQYQSSTSGRFFFPLTIQAGTRIAARASSNFTNDSMQVQIVCFDDSFLSAGAGSAVDTYGFSTAVNLGTAVDCGATANTKGAYTQIASSLTADISGFIINIDNQSATDAAGAQVAALIDVAVGGSGSEVVILPNLQTFWFTGATSNAVGTPLLPYLPLPIAAGTRIAVRGQCSTAVSPDRVFGVTLYGVRQ